MSDAFPPPPDDYDPVEDETVSPAVAAIGARLAVWSQNYACLKATIGPEHLNRLGYIHGAVYMTLLDTVAGYAGVHCPYPGRWRRCVTISLTTQFVASATAGELVAEGRVSGGGEMIFFADGRIFDFEKRLIASASGTFRYIGNSGHISGDLRPDQSTEK